MLFPIAGVPISIELREYLRTPPDDPPTEVARHWITTLRSVWRRIPKIDQRIMLDDMKMYDNGRLSILFVEKWQAPECSVAFIDPNDLGIVAIDAGYARYANSAHLGALIAHELAHYRDFAGDNDSALTEATAYQIAEHDWGYPRPEVIYKCDQCRRIDAILKKRGITGGVFWYAGFRCYAYLRHNRRIRLRASDDDLYLLDENARNSLINVLASDLIPSFESAAARARFMRRRRNRMNYY